MSNTQICAPVKINLHGFSTPRKSSSGTTTASKATGQTRATARKPKTAPEPITVTYGQATVPVKPAVSFMMPSMAATAIAAAIMPHRSLEEFDPGLPSDPFGDMGSDGLEFEPRSRSHHHELAANSGDSDLDIQPEDVVVEEATMDDFYAAQGS